MGRFLTASFSTAALLCACGRLGYDLAPLGGHSSTGSDGGAPSIGSPDAEIGAGGTSPSTGGGGTLGSDASAATGTSGGGDPGAGGSDGINGGAGGAGGAQSAGGAASGGAASGGAGGVLGAGGAIGGAGSDGGASCVGAGPPCNTMTLDYEITNGDKATDAWFRFRVNLTNAGTGDVPLSELTVRDWYTAEAPAPQSLFCDFATISCASVSGAFQAVSPARSGADTVLVVSFSSAAGTLVAGATATVQLRVGKSDLSNYNETNDYSYNGAATTALVANPHITIYRAGVLIWGAEPP